MIWLANQIVGKGAIRNHERVYRGGRPPKWWAISNSTSVFAGHTPQAGGWFWQGRIGPIRYGCGWGDLGTWWLGGYKITQRVHKVAGP